MTEGVLCGSHPPWLGNGKREKQSNIQIVYDIHVYGLHFE